MYKILVVDDNVFDREGVIDLIDWDSLGIQIAGTASNGEEGYKKALELKPDFVLTDVAMPLLNGIQMTKKIKQDLPDMLFIYMSCFDEFDFVKNAISLDVSAYVLKPVDLTELTEALEKIKKIKKNEKAIKENLDELKSKIKESLPVLREQFIRDLVFGKTLDMKNIEEKMKYLGINCQETYLIVLFQIDNYELLYENIPAEDRYLMIYSLKKIIEDVIAVKYNSHLLIQDTSNLCVVVSGSWERNEDALEEIIEDCLICKEEIYRKGYMMHKKLLKYILFCLVMMIFCE
jgi:two-component system, response regulator YesN